MSGNPLTDQRLSFASSEFVWDMDGQTESQRLLLSPVERQLTQHRCRKVLDMGCGNGAFSLLLARSGFEVDGCDASQSGIEIATQNHPEGRFWLQDLAAALPSQHTGCYDAVVSTEVIEHLLLPRKLMTAALQALKPGGLLVVSTPFHGYWKNLALALSGKFDAHWHPLRDFGHIKFFSRSTLTELFAEFGIASPHFETVGRIPAFSRSMIVSGKKPT